MRNVNDTIDPGAITECVLLIKKEISAVAEAEQTILKEKAARLYSLRREVSQREEERSMAHNRRLQEIHDTHTRKISEEHAASGRRAARVVQAFHASNVSITRDIQESKDRRIGRAQGDLIRNRQTRQQDLQSAASEHDSFIQSLAGDRAAHQEIRKQLLDSLRTLRPMAAVCCDRRDVQIAPEDLGATASETRNRLLDTLKAAGEAANDANRLWLAKVFRRVTLTASLVLIVSIHLWLGLRAGGPGIAGVMPSFLFSSGVVLLLWAIAAISSVPVLMKVTALLSQARKLEQAAAEQSSARLAAVETGIRTEEAEQMQQLGETFRDSAGEWTTRTAEAQQDLVTRYNRLPERMERLHLKRITRLDNQRDAEIDAEMHHSAQQSAQLDALQVKEKEIIESESAAEIEELARKWNSTVVPAIDHLKCMVTTARSLFPEWSSAACDEWKVPEEASNSIALGYLKMDVAKLVGHLPSSAPFQNPDLENLLAPFTLGFPHQGSLLFETDGADDGSAARVLYTAALRIIASQPPGRSSFLFIDPVGLGKDFAGLMHLADYEETIITSRIWTQSTHIEERLAEINEHIEKVIQMYLRDEYADINAYNAQAGTIAEKSRFIVISGFPASFSETAARRLRSIASSGARCGVHLLIQRDIRQPSPDPALDEELRRVCRRVVLKSNGFHLLDMPEGSDYLEFDPPPSHSDSVELVHRIGRSSVDSNRVQVPFSQIAPPPDAVWSLDTSEELRVPIGRTGAKKLQMLAIGKGTRQHMVVAGKTGSGKSTLFHVIITNLARWASPLQVEFYLVDFKKGVEFKCYAAKRLPHARVVAIESDREFALSVLQRVDAELKRRGELFRKAGAQDVAGYRRTPQAEALPRTLVLIDEFQEFFTEDDAVAQEASLLLDRIVRQGRAFGIHVILGSQTLGGAYTLARATLGQMVIRVALQCNEADAHLIMDDDNPAPRLLTRPGEGIYNDQAGTLAANSPFQIVWLPEDERDQVLDEVMLRATAGGAVPQAPIVFEGNAPADIRDNPAMEHLRRSLPTVRPKKAHAWLGAPNSIKGHTEAAFQRQSGSHLLVVGQAAERSQSMLTVSVAALAMQFPPGQAEFVIIDPHASEEDGWYHRLATALPQKVRIGGPAELGGLMESLAAELDERTKNGGKDTPEVFVIIQDLQRFKAFRQDDDFRFSFDAEQGGTSPAKAFADLLGEGGPCGMHVIASTDTWNNLSRWIPRKMMAEFEMRVLFQMSANDSANLIDSPAASTLGLHRALFFNEHLGTLETFRPYALPEESWIRELCEWSCV